MTNHPRSDFSKRPKLPQGTDSAAHGISTKKATEIRKEALAVLMTALQDSHVCTPTWEHLVKTYLNVCNNYELYQRDYFERLAEENDFPTRR